MGLVGKIRNRLSPLHGMMPAADYWVVRRSGSFVPGSVTLFGRDILYSDGPGLLHSIEELFEREVYRFKAETSQPYIIDAGANIGLSILYFKRLYPDAKILAFEPDPEIFPMLAQNVAQLSDVEVREVAAWTNDEELTFYSEGSLAGSTELDFANKGNAVTIKAERLRDHIAKGPVDFLKIDIEGAENSVLFDIVDVLPNVRHLFFEYHSHPGKTQQLGELLKLVTDAGFRYVVNGARAPRLPFVQKVSHGFDLQLDVSCFRG